MFSSFFKLAWIHGDNFSGADLAKNVDLVH